MSAVQNFVTTYNMLLQSYVSLTCLGTVATPPTRVEAAPRPPQVPESDAQRRDRVVHSLCTLETELYRDMNCWWGLRVNHILQAYAALENLRVPEMLRLGADVGDRWVPEWWLLIDAIDAATSECEATCTVNAARDASRPG